MRRMGENRCAPLAAAACGFVLGAIVVRLLGGAHHGCCGCGLDYHGHDHGCCCCEGMEEDCGCGPGCGCGCAADTAESQEEAASAE